MFPTFSVVGAPGFDCTADDVEDLDRLLSSTIDYTEFVSTPAVQSVRSHTTGPKALDDLSAVHGGTVQPLDTAHQNKKQRALDKSRDAQKRFRQRQKV